jgi:hypothetical protein
MFSALMASVSGLLAGLYMIGLPFMPVRTGFGIGSNGARKAYPPTFLPCFLPDPVKLRMRRATGREGVKIRNLERDTFTAHAVEMSRLDLAFADMAALSREYAGALSKPCQMRRETLSLVLASAVAVTGLKGGTGEH